TRTPPGIVPAYKRPLFRRCSPLIAVKNLIAIVVGLDINARDLTVITQHFTVLGERSVLTLCTANLSLVRLAFSLLDHEHMAVFVAGGGALGVLWLSSFSRKRVLGLCRGERCAHALQTAR